MYFPIIDFALLKHSPAEIWTHITNTWKWNATETSDTEQIAYKKILLFFCNLPTTVFVVNAYDRRHNTECWWQESQVAVARPVDWILWASCMELPSWHPQHMTGLWQYVMKVKIYFSNVHFKCWSPKTSCKCSGGIKVVHTHLAWITSAQGFPPAFWEKYCSMSSDWFQFLQQTSCSSIKTLTPASH